MNNIKKKIDFALVFTATIRLTETARVPILTASVRSPMSV